MGIISTLYDLSKGVQCGLISELEDVVVDAKYTIFQQLIDGCTNYRLTDTELVLYKGNKAIYSGQYVQFCDCIFITVMYDESGVVYDSNLDYCNDTSLNVLQSLWAIKNKYPERWMFHLDTIYNRFGVDHTNAARELYGYF